MRHLFLPVLILLFSMTVLPEAPIPEDPYTLLKEIPSFNDLFAQKGLTAYSADIRIEGPIVQSITALTTEKNLTPPEFIEYYTLKKGFAFRLKNSGYPPLIRQIIQEMFTPVQAFDRVISLIESKRDLSWFQNFQSSTVCDAKWVQYRNAPHIRLAFTAPQGAIESRLDTLTGKPRNTLTTGMTFILDPASHIVKVLKIDQTEKSGGSETRLEKKFTFDYQKINNRAMPSELTIEKNGKEEVRFKAAYVVLNGFTVFSQKEFRYATQGGKPETVTLSYSRQRFNKDVDFSFLGETETNGSEGALTDETEAEKLFLKAKNNIMDGKTSSAKSLLKKIIKEYPATSYAEQAKTLLNGLTE